MVLEQLDLFSEDYSERTVIPPDMYYRVKRLLSAYAHYLTNLTRQDFEHELQTRLTMEGRWSA